MDITQLRTKLQEAKTAFFAVESKYRERRYALELEVHRKLQAEMGEELAQARMNVSEAERAWKAEDDRLVIAAATPMHQEGTILTEWTWNRSTNKWLNTKNRAVMQVYRQGDEYAGASYRCPMVGTIIIRPLKKDGTPGKKLHQWDNEVSPRFWVPEGIEPQWQPNG